MEWVGDLSWRRQMVTHSVALVDSSDVFASTSETPTCKQLLLNGYLRREELAKQFGLSPRTIDRWEALRKGPPRVSIGRTILYNIQPVREWLVSQERQASR